MLTLLEVPHLDSAALMRPAKITRKKQQDGSGSSCRFASGCRRLARHEAGKDVPEDIVHSEAACVLYRVVLFRQSRMTYRERCLCVISMI